MPKFHQHCILESFQNMVMTRMKRKIDELIFLHTRKETRHWVSRIADSVSVCSRRRSNQGLENVGETKKGYLSNDLDEKGFEVTFRINRWWCDWAVYDSLTHRMSLMWIWTSIWQAGTGLSIVSLSGQAFDIQLDMSLNFWPFNLTFWLWLMSGDTPNAHIYNIQ